MSSSALPPPGNLPSWSRVPTLDRTRYPRAFVRDRFANGGTTITPDHVANSTMPNVDIKMLESMSSSVHFDKSIKFLQQQHAETLLKLHDELDHLKRENKELNFKMISTNHEHRNISTIDDKRHPIASDIKVLVLEEQVKDLRHALNESSLKNSEMQQLILSMQSKSDQKQDSDKIPVAGAARSSRFRHKRLSISKSSIPLPLNASLNPLRVQTNPTEAPHTPTLEQCELVIQHLHEANCQQLAELTNMRISSKTSKHSQSNTPDSVALKTYGPLESGPFSDMRLPRIPVKPPAKKTIKSAAAPGIKVSLPALKNTISSTVIERTKRQNAVQKQRRGYK